MCVCVCVREDLFKVFRVKKTLIDQRPLAERDTNTHDKILGLFFFFIVNWICTVYEVYNAFYIKIQLMLQKAIWLMELLWESTSNCGLSYKCCNLSKYVMTSRSYKVPCENNNEAISYYVIECNNLNCDVI